MNIQLELETILSRKHRYKGKGLNLGYAQELDKAIEQHVAAGYDLSPIEEELWIKLADRIISMTPQPIAVRPDLHGNPLQTEEDRYTPIRHKLHLSIFR